MRGLVCRTDGSSIISGKSGGRLLARSPERRSSEGARSGFSQGAKGIRVEVWLARSWEALDHDNERTDGNVGLAEGSAVQVKERRVQVKDSRDDAVQFQESEEQFKVKNLSGKPLVHINEGGGPANGSLKLVLDHVSEVSVEDPLVNVAGLNLEVGRDTFVELNDPVILCEVGQQLGSASPLLVPDSVEKYGPNRDAGQGLVTDLKILGHNSAQGSHTRIDDENHHKLYGGFRDSSMVPKLAPP